MIRAIPALCLATSMAALAAQRLLGRIAYRTSEWSSSRVVAMDAAGGDHIQLARVPDSGFPHWSPDGTRVAVGHQTMDLDGRGPDTV
ncbi:hypothetical protein HN371_08145 [Candidatus Poribacteria bacterium]|jgi:Tol biopolymer transport system component|nr:hypothetical protein [Candidatus Poribacteria bacterium]MBT5537045.1 hypothetical protein [Candidatus Poribacteria bacterium]MBT5713311.1 hypothetical protein [Candidatus Poribacteria bacterium]MBT7100951.1 hypothetical protein [Candidatus Poribacteria bacterium]MBT7809010.1 hypothetical protein [Candidatus Poribacteria bacterium]